MRRALLAILPALAASTLAPAAGAQPAAPAPATAAPAGAGAAPAPLVWTLSLSMREAYESNVLYGYYLGAGQSTGDFLTRASATLGRTFPSPRSRFAISLTGGGSVYRQVTELNSMTWGARVGAGHDFGRRLSGDAQVSSELGYVRDFVRLDPTTTLAPYTLTRYDSGTATLRFLATRATALHLDARGERYAFPNQTAALTDGKSFVVSGGLDHTFAAGSRLSGIAEYERTAYGPKFEVERLLGRWKQTVFRDWAAEFGAGVAAYRQIATVPLIVPPGMEDPTQTRFGPVLRATIDGARGRHSLKLSASRDVGQTYGFGTVGSMTDVAFAYGLAFSHVAFVANAAANRSSDVPVGVQPDGFKLGAGLRWEAVRRLQFVLDSYWWDRRGGTPITGTKPWSGWSVALSINYDLSWR
jgi:hypothetical protein